MARPFIEFLQSQAIPWSDARPTGRRNGVSGKELSHDPGTGARSLLLRYPPGWRAAGTEILAADEELFVLDGELRINGRSYPRLSYAHLPAGYPRTELSAPSGCQVLTFFSGAADEAPDAGFDESRLVEYVHALDGQWGGNFSPQFPPGAGRKFLREDPYSGEQTWLLGTLPLRWGRRAETHPVVEEMFLLAGELVSPLGAMGAGAYFWRPPHEVHGPFGSLTGCLMFFRSVGGPLSTHYCEDEQDFDWLPEHRPVLPDHLAASAVPAPRVRFAP